MRLLAALPFSLVFPQPHMDESLLNLQLMQKSLEMTKRFRKRALRFLRQQLWLCFHTPTPICLCCTGLAGLYIPFQCKGMRMQVCSCAKICFDPSELCSFLISSVGSKVPWVKRAPCFTQRKSYGSIDIQPWRPDLTGFSKKNDWFLNCTMIWSSNRSLYVSSHTLSLPSSFY